MATYTGGAYTENQKVKKKVPTSNGAFKELTFKGSQPAQKTRVVVKPASYNKSTWDTKTKVSQGTINEIKKMGMSEALGTVKGAVASSKGDSSAKAWAEGVRRLYGDKRFNAAVGTSTPGKTAPRGAVMAGKAEAARKPLSKAVKTELSNNNKQKFSGTTSRMGGGSTSGRDTKPKIKSTSANDTVRNLAGGAVVGALATAVGRKVLIPAAMGFKAAKELAATAGSAAKVVAKVVKPAAKVVTKATTVTKAAKPVTKVVTKTATVTKKAKVKPVGTPAEYAAKARSEALSTISRNRSAEAATAKKNAGKAYPGSKNIGTVNEFADRAKQAQMRKEIQARAAKRIVKKK